MNNVKNIIAVVSNALSSTSNGVSFFGVKGYTNKQGETSNYTINIGGNFANAKLKDIEYLKTLDVSTLESSSDVELLEKARVELLNSLINPNKKRQQAQVDAYTKVNGAIKIHNESGAIMVFGTRVNKKVLVEGVYKEVKSRPLTIAKNTIKKGMKSTKYRMFKVEAQPEQVQYSGGSDTILVEMV